MDKYGEKDNVWESDGGIERERENGGVMQSESGSSSWYQAGYDPAPQAPALC